MYRCLIKVLWFISSYLPLYILLLILHPIYLSKIQGDDGLNYSAILFIFILVTGIILSILFIILFLTSTDGNTLLCNKIERPDDKVISYIFTYITPIISVDISRFSTIIANVLLFLMVLFLYIRLDLFYINPVLIFIGYIPYKVDDKMLISDMTFSKIKRFKRELRGYYITNEIFVAKSKYNKTI